jgi:mono/diheme cytochrome c family protein
MASPFCRLFHFHQGCDQQPCGPGEHGEVGEWEGTWYWLRSPEEEKRVTANIFNRYCIRCHGADGRGVWDIPDVPNFTNPRWQESRSDAQIARIILEGRGAVMPPFRGTLSLEEAWAMARYLRTFLPGAASRPDLGSDKKKSVSLPEAAPQQ